MRKMNRNAYANKRPVTRSVSQKPSLALDLWRFKLLWAGVAMFFGILVLRAFYVQIIDHKFLQQKADAMILRNETLKATRGVISDRNGVPLAISTPIVNLWIDPKEYLEAQADQKDILEQLKKEPHNRSLKRQLSRNNFSLDDLADAVGLDRAFVKNLVQSKPRSRFVELKREVPPAVAKVVLDRHFQSVYGENDYKRYYPQAQSIAQIIGITNRNGAGVEGLEMAWNKQLAGQDGLMRVMRDRRGNRIKDVEMVQAEKPGENVSLSIDSRLQYIMYRELTAAGIANNARSATAVAMDVKTGEILAMASWPSYNPNDPDGLNNKDAMRNRAAVDMFEPGSTMKPMTISAALETGKVSPSTVISTSPGSMVLGNHVIHDTHNYGALDLRGIIVKSSNVGAAKVSMLLPPQTVPTFFKKMGFGTRSAVHFPGESPGMIPPAKEWTQARVGTMAYGYGENATVLQLAQAYSTIADGGVHHPVSLLKLDQPPKGEQLLDSKIANEVLSMMEGVTAPGGTATEAEIPGYRVAGKTGTAHKLRADGKGYSATEYRALFVGIAPVSNPRIAMAVVVENPIGQYYGGLVSAPIFARVMQESLRLLNVPLDKALTTVKASPSESVDR